MASSLLPAMMTKKAFLSVICVGALLSVTTAAPSSRLAFQNLIPTFGAAPAKGAVALEDALIAEIASEDDRLVNSDKVSSLVTQLEQSGKSIPRPAIAPQVMGRWRLLQTTNTDTSSPIQRKAVDTSKFPIYQDILLNEDVSILNLLEMKILSIIVIGVCCVDSSFITTLESARGQSSGQVLRFGRTMR